MKKKILMIFIMLGTIFLTSGCFGGDELEGSSITTTVYPIEYLVSRLYGYNSKVTSIYPNDTDVNEFELTNKQIKDYSKKTNLFVYNGLSDEKEIAKTLLNKNKKIQIIDASYGIKYTYGVEELWLNPSYYLNLASEIKDNLIELSASKYAAEQIQSNYDDIEEDLSILDATLRNIGKTSQKNDKNTIIIAYDSFGFLKDYGFNVINISNENNLTTNIRDSFKNKTYQYIFVKDIKDVPNHIKDLEDNYGVQLIEVDTMDTLTDDQRNNNDNYLTIMNDFISNLSTVVLG